MQAERDGKDMMEHGLEDEDNADAGGAYAPSTVDLDDEECETDTSPAAYYLGRISAGRIGSGSRATRTTTSDACDDRPQPPECPEE